MKIYPFFRRLHDARHKGLADRNYLPLCNKSSQFLGYFYQTKEALLEFATFGNPIPGICFDSGDNNDDQWYPQGVTTVADMQADQTWGDGYKPILVSWYDHNNNADGNRGVRLTFVNHNTGKYRHVLLVYPRAPTNGIVEYDTVRVSQSPGASGYNTALHAGGITWFVGVDQHVVSHLNVLLKILWMLN